MRNPSEYIRVLLVDDHAVVRAGLRLLLNQSVGIAVAGEAERGEQVCAGYAELQPDVVLMDLSLPGIGGLGAIRRLLQREPAARVLVFSVFDEPVYVTRALQAGARGYVTKNSAPEILCEAIRRLSRNQTYLEPELAQKLALQGIQRPLTDDALAALSPREFEIFCLLAQGQTPRQAADRLCLSYKTVANHVTTIKAKLNLQSAAEMARLAYLRGLLEP